MADPAVTIWGEGKVVVWRELGRWVFAIGRPTGVLYFQCFSGDRLDERGGSDVRLALTQLQLQGVLDPFPDEVIVWSHGSATDARPEELESFSRGLGLSASSAPKPAPSWPTPPSRLLPADVRAERMEKKNQRNRNLMVAAAVIAYVGLIGFLFFPLLVIDFSNLVGDGIQDDEVAPCSDAPSHNGVKKMRYYQEYMGTIDLKGQVPHRAKCYLAAEELLVTRIHYLGNR